MVMELGGGGSKAGTGTLSKAALARLTSTGKANSVDRYMQQQHQAQAQPVMQANIAASQAAAFAPDNRDTEKALQVAHQAQAQPVVQNNLAIKAALDKAALDAAAFKAQNAATSAANQSTRQASAPSPTPAAASAPAPSSPRGSTPTPVNAPISPPSETIGGSTNTGTIGENSTTNQGEGKAIGSFGAQTNRRNPRRAASYTSDQLRRAAANRMAG